MANEKEPTATDRRRASTAECVAHVDADPQAGPERVPGSPRAMQGEGLTLGEAILCFCLVCAAVTYLLRLAS